MVHWYTNLLFLALPFIKEELDLSDVQVGAIVTVQMGVNGGFIIISGFLADSFRRHGAAIVSAAVVSFGLALFVIGILPKPVVHLVLVLAGVQVPGRGPSIECEARKGVGHVQKSSC